MARHPLMTDAASRKQNDYAARVEKDRAELLRSSIQAVMGTTAGRLLMWELLERAGVYQSIWTPNAEIHYRAGRQDFGHELMALLTDANEELYEQMAREARHRVKREEAGSKAVQASTAEETNG
jgi:hypothetical protein